jgi:hypothetical protein
MTAEQKLQIAIKALQAIIKNDVWSVPVAKHALEQIAQAKEQGK